MQGQVLLSSDLRRLLRVQHEPVSGSDGCGRLLGQVVDTSDVASVAEPLLRTVVLLQHCGETLQGV